MADVTFRFLPERRPNPGPWAAQLAALRGVFGDECKTAKPFELMPRLVRAWRVQVSRWRRSGWDPAQGKNFQWLRNCPPFGHGVEVDGPPRELRPCHLNHVCPHCWGRRTVAPAYDTLAAALRALGSPPPPEIDPEFPYRIASARTVHDFPGADPMKVLPAGRDATKRLSELWTKCGALGGIGLTTVYPTASGYRYDGRVLAVLPREQLSIEVPGGLPRLTRIVADVDVRQAVLAVARFGRYPGALLRGPGDAALALLEARARTPRARYSFTFGCCYGLGRENESSARQDNQED